MISTAIIASFGCGFVLFLYICNYYFSEVMGARPEDYENNVETFYGLCAVDFCFFAIGLFLIFLS